jgi:RNA polymerase sigma-70 factor (ECF subfamily)
MSPIAPTIPATYSPARVDDSTLLAKIAEGENTALGALFDRWSKQVYSTIMQLLRDTDEAEDLVEETFWLVWKNPGGVQTVEGSAEDALVAMGRQKGLDRMRGHRREREELLGDKREFGDLVNTAASSAESAQNESQQQFIRVLRGLDPDERQMLELAYFRGLSQSEIMELTGEDGDVVKLRMVSAMTNLAERGQEPAGEQN